MKTVFAKVALAALCATALTAVSQTANAGTVTITGNVLNIGPTPLYGPAVSSDNVVNSPGSPATGSVLLDPTGPNLTASTPWVMQGGVSSNVAGAYTTAFYFTGSESGYNITFSAPGVTPFTEGNQNNNAYAGGPPLTGPLGAYQLLGTSTGSGPGLINFTLTWNGGGPGNTVSNTGTQSLPGDGTANLIFSYLDPSTYASLGLATLTTTPGDWFAFALNDNGGNDDNHDDFVGFAEVTACGEAGCGAPPGFTPIPAALPLFGSVLGGGFVAGVWRKRRKPKLVKA
jgi:hypothetical protein